MIIDWLWDRPSARIPFVKALIWLKIPIAYVAYSLIRGMFVGWYPYPFLDPANGGYIQILLMTIVIAAFGVAAVFAVSRVGQPRPPEK
jgi:NADH:ubiquinone oxidoreductase subunit 3 (subunit A)